MPGLYLDDNARFSEYRAVPPSFLHPTPSMECGANPNKPAAYPLLDRGSVGSDASAGMENGWLVLRLGRQLRETASTMSKARMHKQRYGS